MPEPRNHALAEASAETTRSSQAAQAGAREAAHPTTFPLSAGILFGLGLGGFFDGIILHQVLQWHHMLSSAGYPPDSVRNLEINVLWDGLFHLSTYIFTA